MGGVIQHAARSRRNAGPTKHSTRVSTNRMRGTLRPFLLTAANREYSLGSLRAPFTSRIRHEMQMESVECEGAIDLR